MNIRVDLNTPIKGGTEVVFRSPVDCSQVTGLKLYYPGADGNTTSQEFAFADAHGNNVGDIDHLFAENVAVKVILDVTTGMAFVQNADTNAYLESRFDGIIDTLCPSFTENGPVAVCEPLEGYPLEVISTFNVSAPLSGIQLTQCGKNLFDFKQPVSYVTYTSSNGAQGSRYGYSFVLPAGTYTMHAERVGEVKDTYIYCILNDLKGNHLSVDGFGHMKQGTSYWTRTFTLTESAVLYIYDGVSSHTEKVAQALFSEQNNVQIEAGSAATAYEEYYGNQWTVDVANIEGGVRSGSYLWNKGILFCTNGVFQYDPETGTFAPGMGGKAMQNIPAMYGVNYFYSDCGDTQVKGKADPVKIIEKLTNAILALGGNV